MVDFVEYVVSELRSKRLSKEDATALVKQFAGRAAVTGQGPIIHPLLHSNVSDLGEQRYRATLTGDEFFLSDHRVRMEDGVARRVLPGVVYLEMARAAIEHALPPRTEPTMLELRHVVWAQPIVVDATTQVSIALRPSSDDDIGYEIYTESPTGEEIVHCQGDVIVTARTPRVTLDLDQLRGQMSQGTMDSASVGALCAGMGLVYGPSFQVIAAIHRGPHQALAQLRMPAMTTAAAEQFYLHPSSTDGALQAAIGLIDMTSEPMAAGPRLPFALDSLRLYAPCTGELLAWVRHSRGRDATSAIIKLDIDVCDTTGNVCVELRGLSARSFGRESTERISTHQASALAGAPAGALGALDAESLTGKTQDYLRSQLSDLLKVPSRELDPRAALENYGVDSILAMQLTDRLEATFGSLSKTLFFEYQTIRELAGYFIEHHSAQLEALVSVSTTRGDGSAATAAAATEEARRPERRRARRWSVGQPRTPQNRVAPVAREGIAIVGLSGRYPESLDLDAYWRNLRDGIDCIREVPSERWNWREYFSKDRSQRGRHFSKWGGFIAGVDEFDPLFFNISPLEAEHIDPQERLFLQHVWMAIEDAGYTRDSLQVPSADDVAGQVGVYVGVMYSEYQLFGAEAHARGAHVPLAGSTASIANRVSYVLNLHGPSLTLDTMCSSSLSAIHLACEDLRHGRTTLAIAGGVNLSIHPAKYLVLSAGQFISSDGHCQSFGEGGDGYIPGEGVGVVILKRLAEAVQDGDRIYGVIRGSALNHGGKTNGYTVPNPHAQTSVIRRALVAADVDARQIGYVEAHGTGTKLGDPIEIGALTKAFRHDTADTAFCAIGSVKSNIGHCESAAGIAGLTKVLLQMQHQQLVPSLHSDRLNPHIDFPTTPFIVNQTLTRWEPPVIDGLVRSRIAGVSSFGAGGSNAHLIVEEYRTPLQEPLAVPEVLVLLSARTPEQLRQKARDLLEFIGPRVSSLDLTALAHTLQAAREAMAERVAFVVSSTAELVEKLEAYGAESASIPDAYYRHGTRGRDGLSVFSTDADLQVAIHKWITNRKLSKLADVWTRGLDVDWSGLYGGVKPPRISLPPYPFARERYWIDVDRAARDRRLGAATHLHPLLHSNTSDLSEQRFRSLFSGEEFFFVDHRVSTDGHHHHPAMPAVAYLEMARSAVEHAWPSRSASLVMELRNTVWAQPLIVERPTSVSIALAADDRDEIEYEIRSASQDGDDPIVHCQGHAVVRHAAAPARLDLEQLERRMRKGHLRPEVIYENCTRLGLVHGPALQAIVAVQRGDGEVLASLHLPEAVASTSGAYVLHPSLMDGALQAAMGLLDTAADPGGSTRARLPFALDMLRILAPCTAQMRAWVRVGPRAETLDIDLCDRDGQVCVQMHGLSSRPLNARRDMAATAAPVAISPRPPAVGTLYAVPVWEASCASPRADAADNGELEHHVILCELPWMDIGEVQARLPRAQCARPHAKDACIARRYIEYAVACFERIQAIFRSKPKGRVFVQIVTAGDGEEGLQAGLAALLKTAALENPKFSGQLLIVGADLPAAELAKLVEAEVPLARDPVITYAAGERRALLWREVEAETDATESPSTAAFADRGVYLITGGLGGLGLLFAHEVLRQTVESHVILTGRSPLEADKQAALDRLATEKAGRVSYRQADVSDADVIRGLIAAIVQEHGRLTGILHSAGVIADNYILRKSTSECRGVLAPKVLGVHHLDQASRDVDLDFFVVFSSLAGALGNMGQADYAAANAFLDRFAAYRNCLVAAGQRRGRTLAINWPLWQDGGMRVNPATEAWVAERTGMVPMSTGAGLRAFYRALASPHDQMLVVAGDLVKLRSVMLGTATASAEPTGVRPTPALDASTVDLVVQTEDYLRRQLASALKLPARSIDPHAALETYGIDSILAMTLTNELEKSFGSLPKTLLFEYQTIAALAQYFSATHPAGVRALFAKAGESLGAKADETRVHAERAVSQLGSRRRVSRRVPPEAACGKEIAIVGLAGRYPQAANLQELWRNLQQGRDCITEVPPDRWDHAAYFDADPTRVGKTYSKWGGFVPDVAAFDPLFFNMSPREAALIDPQERLFLQTAWETVEDAGYTRAQLAGRRIGVFVGVMWGQYELLGVDPSVAPDIDLPISSHSSIANRVSYVLDLRGPSIALDTMCSSSLTAIHLACDALRQGEIEAAIAGGVNLTLHPYKYLCLSQGRFVASDGRCRSFGAGGDGYVPGEGVGAVLLKPLQDAVRDGDQIYGVIKSSVVNHGGKTNGYTVPNPNAQAELVLEAMEKAGIDARALSYIETHGTGTALGDPIEIAGLAKAFEMSTDKKQFCPIGSIKSNIGHLESAAGIAAVTKALLQVRNDQLVPSLFSDPPNPHIDFSASPFYVQATLSDWPPSPEPRRIGVSSFGAGGANAHLILEEYLPARVVSSPSRSTRSEAFVLSAIDEAALWRYAERMVNYLQQDPRTSLSAMAYTSQVGRTPMGARLAIVTPSVDALKTTLMQWLAQPPADLDSVFYGNLNAMEYRAESLIDGDAGRAFLQDLLAKRDLERLAKLWVLGVPIDWARMWSEERPSKVSLPTYPFAKERCWIAERTRSPQTRRRPVRQARQLPEGRPAPRPVQTRVAAVESTTSVHAIEGYLKALVGDDLQLAPERIDSTERLDSFGLDSVVIQRLTSKLEEDFGELPKTLIYEHDTIRDLAAFLSRERREKVIERFGSGSPVLESPSLPQPYVTTASADDDGESIAIIGIHCEYPHAASLDEYWGHLSQGRELIATVPSARWDCERLYNPDPAAADDGKIYCKWGGFLENHDKFDPRFFNISPAEAALIDPQERLFLESVWAALEDAGYTRDTLKQCAPKGRSADVGVFVGVTTNSYHLWAPEEHRRGHHVSPSAMPWSIANRVSYVFDFNGPSMPVDTACSSSSVAIHLACESIKNGQCRVAIAGGVNLYLHPAKYLSLCKSRMLSRDGKCRSYGAGGEGFVPGEGVGSVVLKRLSQAVAEQDRIYAVIRSSAFDHCGRSHGYTAPNPHAQAELISRTLDQAGAHPESIRYVEGHGTGTLLGDSLEIAALTQAFQRDTPMRQFCAIGSVKANIGHAESAAGMAGLAKVVLQFKHRQLAPSISSDEVNPEIDFDESPFYLQHELAEWPDAADHPRRALINAFGAGGVNACMLVEEYVGEAPVAFEGRRQPDTCLFTLSARTEERLREYAARLLAQLRRERTTLDLASVCYTLQIGREAMDERLAIVARDVDQLVERLDEWTRHGSLASADVYRGSCGEGRRIRALSSDATAEQSDVTQLAMMWVSGQQVDWDALYPDGTPRRIGLPTYPFARERYWVSDADAPAEDALEPQTLAHRSLHPLVSHNSSTLKAISFSSWLSDRAFYAVDHHVNGEALLPAAGLVEIACIAGNLAGEKKVRRLADIVWIQPLAFRAGPQAVRTVLSDVGDMVEYSITSLDDDQEEVVHSEGRLVFGDIGADPAALLESVSIHELKAQCQARQEGTACYELFGRHGLRYGPAFQTVQEIFVHETYALARLKLADTLYGESDRYILHPSLIDGAFQATVGLMGETAPDATYVPFALDAIDIIKPLPRICYAHVIRADAGEQARSGAKRFDIRLLNESGDVLVQMKNLCLKALSPDWVHRRYAVTA